MQKPKNALYAQSGGVTAVINTTAVAVIENQRQHMSQINKLYACQNGILGVLKEELFDTTLLSDVELERLKRTPAGAFGSCRYKLKEFVDSPREYERLLEVFSHYDIGYFFYNGGNDSMDTAHKISKYCALKNYPLQCIGIPKTIDNDLPFTDHCPGFGSVAKYVAISIMEAGLDVASMAASSTKVFVLEVMGRHAGWIAAAAGLAAQNVSEPPHLILFPEVPFDEQHFLKKVSETIEQYGHCAIVVSEGVKTKDGKFLSDSGSKDAFGHVQLGGVGNIISNLIKNKLQQKVHFAVSDYLQRSARHIASLVDHLQAESLGKSAILKAIKGKKDIMLTIERLQTTPYLWQVGEIDFEKVANQERKVPPHFIDHENYRITKECYDYLSPLIQGEAFPSFENGLPQYLRLKLPLIPKVLPIFD